MNKTDTTPTIKISCWTCKHYVYYWLRCSKTKREIQDDKTQYCYDWQARKRAIGIEISEFNHKKEESENKDDAPV